MEDINTLNSKSLTVLTIQEVAQKIKKKDIDATRKWLDERNITIYKDSKPHYVYEIDIDCEMDKPYVRNLRNKHPNNWEEIYKKVAKDNSVYELVVLSLSGEISTRPTTKLKITRSDDVKLYKQLMK